MLLSALAACAAPTSEDLDAVTAAEDTGTTAEPLTAIANPLDVAATRITVGDHHVCANTSRGVACWGGNDYGQLGIGTVGGRAASPVAVTGFAGTPSTLDAGRQHVCANTSAGVVQCWGRDDTRQAGGTATSYSSPHTVASVASGALAMGAYQSCVLNAGAAHCWGRTGHNLLGDNTFTEGATEIARTVLDPSGAPLSNLTSIDAGQVFSCATRSPTQGNDVFCWGDKITSTSTAPYYDWVASKTYKVTLPAAPLSLAVGYGHACAVLVGTDHEVYCWGQSSYGETGTQAAAVTTPVRVPGVSGASRVVAGWRHTCALLSSGNAVCWGYNGYGQLGNGAPAAWLPPVPVAGLSNITAMAAGGFSTCALAGGYAYCWGHNSSGQLGNGTTTDASTPTHVRWALVNAP